MKPFLCIFLLFFMALSYSQSYYCGNKCTFITRTGAIVRLQENEIILECYIPWQGSVVPKRDTIRGHYSSLDSFVVASQNEDFRIAKSAKKIEVWVSNTLAPGTIHYRLKPKTALSRRFHRLRNAALLHEDWTLFQQEIASELNIINGNFIFDHIQTQLEKLEMSKLARKKNSTDFSHFYYEKRPMIKATIIAEIKERHKVG